MTRLLRLGGLGRDLRERNVKVMLAAMLIAVTTVATINLFADQLQRTLIGSASSLLAADRQISSRSSAPVPQDWLERAGEHQLKTGRMAEFQTMIAADERFQLVSVKAVDSHYPLRGEVEWQPSLDAPRQLLSHGPARGEVWLNARLMRLLDLAPGDQVEVGVLDLTVTGVIAREPDAGFSLSSFAPRILMHYDDIDATEAIQPGSRIRHRALLAGSDHDLAAYHAWLSPRLDETAYRWVDIRQGETLGRSLERAEHFLLLGGSLAVLLAVVAIAVSSREYARGQRDGVALLKTLGLTGGRIAAIYIRKLLLWGAVTTLAGLLLALPLSWTLAMLAARVMDQPLQFQFHFWALWPALLTAMATLFAFAYPPIIRLRNTPAMRVFRSLPTDNRADLLLDLLLATLVVFGLLWVYVRQIELVVALLTGTLALVLLLLLLSWLVVALLRRSSRGAGPWRLAIVALYRHRHAMLAQTAVFSLTLMLAATLVLVRSSLLADWQAQLPENAPNHFLLNIAPEAVPEVERFLAEYALVRSPLYPIVRGRLTEINGEPVQQVARDPDDGELRRELNLTEATVMPDDNEIIRGAWFAPGETQGLSLEQSLAENIGARPGDMLTFSIGAETITVPVTSIRSVQWDSLKPNFFVIFPSGGALKKMPSTWMTSFYLPDEDKPLLNRFVRAFPTVSVLEVDHLVERIRQITGQVTRAVEAILVMILMAAIAVMVAVVSATMAERQREGALLRTLGGRQGLLARATIIEFALIGLLAGLLGALAAELALWLLQQRMFDGEFRWHWSVVLSAPLVSALLLAVLGRWQLQPVLRVSPMLLLRRLE